MILGGPSVFLPETRSKNKKTLGPPSSIIAFCHECERCCDEYRDCGNKREGQMCLISRIDAGRAMLSNSQHACFIMESESWKSMSDQSTDTAG
jgi:hypothetical protein